MSGLAQRRKADLERVQRLADSSQGQLRVLTMPSATQSTLRLQVERPTAGDDAYPARVLASFRLAIELPARYPFDPPVARLEGTAVFHPNVFPSGVVCVGSKWHPGEGLDLYVTRVARLLCFDGMLVNLNSIAQPVAGHWYRRARGQHPEAFPTARIDWRVDDERVIRKCPSCESKLRLPTARSGEVQCPRCQHLFTVQT